jgi:hypothetical protein
LDNSNYINFHGGGDFSHAYVNASIIFGKTLEMQKMNTQAFINNLTRFFT